MKYQIYQIQLSKLDEQNEPLLEAYHSISISPTEQNISANFKLFNKVAIIDAIDEEDAFAISNLGEEEHLIERLASMHSLSVGDVLIDENNKASFVDTFGFKSFDLPRDEVLV